MTDSPVSVHSCHHQNLRREVDDHHLKVLHRPTQEVVALKSIRYVPYHLWQNVEESHQHVSYAEVHDKRVHPAGFLSAVTQGEEHTCVAKDSQTEYEALDSYLPRALNSRHVVGRRGTWKSRWRPCRWRFGSNVNGGTAAAVSVGCRKEAAAIA